MEFFSQLSQEQKTKKTSLCVGLDPNPEKFPEGLPGGSEGIYKFLSQVIGVTAHYACAFKPQVAYFSAFRAEDVLEQLIADIHRDHPTVPVVLDAKRGDIGSTAEMYAREAFERYRADAVTVNPYMGADSVLPFASYSDKGVFVLCRTSNPSAGETQNLSLESGEKYFQFLAKMAVSKWNAHKNLGFVVGATAVDELTQIRQLCPESWFLVPGVGAQGGSLSEVLLKGSFSQGGGVLVNSSRGILYKSAGPDFAEASRASAQELQVQMERYF